MSARGVVIALAGLVVLAAGCGGEDSPALPEGRALAASSTITPPVALFGDPITARVDVLVDEEELDPDRLVFEPDFAPYEILGDPVVERRDLGRYARLRYAYTLRCITLDCVELLFGGGQVTQPGGIPPPSTGAEGFGERKTIQIKASSLRYDDPEGGERVLRRLTWPSLQSVSRLNFGDTTTTGIGFPFRASVTPLPEATFRLPPWLLAGALLAAAAVLLAFPAIVVARALRKPPPEVVEEHVELTPLERALALVEWARARDDVAELREALEVLAVELDDESRDGLGRRTRELAWSPVPPAAETAGRLLDDVREEVGGPPV